MRKALVALILVIASGSAIAQEPPIRGGLVEGVKCGSDPTQTYTLFLPSTYDPETLWPVLLVLDPRGRSVTAAELFRESAEEYGWIILSSNDTRSDTVDNPNIRAINAMWPELQMRYAADPRRIYAAAFSGTMVSAFLMGRGYDDFGGVIGAGGRFFPQILRGAEFPPSDERLTVQIGLADLLERKDRDGIEGTTARRLLNHVFTMTSFYLTRDLLADHRYTHAAASLGVATRIRDNPVVWYNLACAEAMSGRENAALDALEKAVETGFDDVQLMKSDEDLESIRGTERYQKLVRGLEVLRS
jgi:hypothetical protein